MYFDWNTGFFIWILGGSKICDNRIPYTLHIFKICKMKCVNVIKEIYVVHWKRSLYWHKENIIGFQMIYNFANKTGY